MNKVSIKAAFFLLASAAAASPLGCAASAEGDDAAEESGESGDVGATTDELSTACKITRAQILASVSGARRTAIQRGFGWWDANVPYNQSKSYGGYRTDCSGFVSMCWSLPRSYTTADFITNSGPSHLLPGYGSLLPGDALVRHVSLANAHVVLFLGWNDAAKTSACVLEQNSTALDMEFGTRSASSLRNGGYKAIRGDKF